MRAAASYPEEGPSCRRALRRDRGFAARLQHLPLTGADVVAISGVRIESVSSGNALIRCPAPDHEDRNPSCSVNLVTGQAHCFACRWSAGDVVALHLALGRFTRMGEALADLERRAGTAIPRLEHHRPAHGPRRDGAHRTAEDARSVVVAKWVYYSANGSPAFEVHRIQFRRPDGTWVTKEGGTKPRKAFRQTHPGGRPARLPTAFRNGNRPLYMLPSLLSFPSDTVFVVEGEKAADALVSTGRLASTSSGGASQPHLTDWGPLAGRSIVLWPDNDSPGRRFMAHVAALLAELRPKPRIRHQRIEHLELPDGGDAADWIALGKEVEHG